MNKDNFDGNSRSFTDILGNTWHYDCMGCAMSKSDIAPPGGIIYKGKYTILAADPEVPIPGFVVVNTKRHIRSFSELKKEERIEIANIITHAERAVKNLNICKEIVLIQEERSRHLHIWIFPYSEWMVEKYGSGASYLRDIMKYCVENNNQEKTNEVLDAIKKIKEYFKKCNIDE